ncbi:hypothetical protein Lser_V15G22705 [Lactuca serriola]
MIITKSFMCRFFFSLSCTIDPKSTASKDPPYAFWCFQDCVVRLSVTLYIDLYSVVSLEESDRYQLGVHSISRVGFVGLSEAPRLKRMKWLAETNPGKMRQKTKGRLPY